MPCTAATLATSFVVATAVVAAAAAAVGSASVAVGFASCSPY